jgi:hypothetical protein
VTASSVHAEGGRTSVSLADRDARSVAVERAEAEGSPRRVLVVGAARSGTTWVGEVLGKTQGASYLHEPDSFDWVPFAARARAGLGLLPAVEPGDPAPRLYAKMWDAAFQARREALRNDVATRIYARIGENEKYKMLPPGGRRSRRLRVVTRLAGPRYSARGAAHLVVKSVTVPLALEWIAARTGASVVLVRRNPLDVIASRVALGPMFLGNVLDYVDEQSVASRLARWNAPPRPAQTDRFANFVWMAGFTMSAYDEVAAAHPEFHVVDHESLCADPVRRFRRLVMQLGLDWTDDCEAYLHSSNTPGTGFETKRVAAELGGNWPMHLSAEQAATARRILSQFPIARLYPELLSA